MKKNFMQKHEIDVSVKAACQQNIKSCSTIGYIVSTETNCRITKWKDGNMAKKVSPCVGNSATAYIASDNIALEVRLL